MNKNIIAMKRNIKIIWLPSLLSAIMLLTVACSTDDEDNLKYGLIDDGISSSILYEGEWTVNKQVVDTGLLQIEDDLVYFNLPDTFLLSTYIIPMYAGGSSDKTANVSYEPLDYSSSVIRITPLGYTGTSQYNSVSSPTVQDFGVQLLNLTCSFEALINGASYKISLLSEEKAMAIQQKTSDQWTLSIPVDAFRLENLSPNEPTVEKLQLPSTVTLYFNTKRRID